MPPVETKTTEKKEEKKEDNIKSWNDSEVQLLKKWGETASSYRLLHDRAYRIYYRKSYMYAVPIIVFSTITGTASFSQTLFPITYQPYVPMVIGGVNIFIGVLGTIARFFRVDELTEAHRVASVSYGKFARNIATELSLPPQNRKYNGADLVEMCRTEMDRLIEQSPVIPMDILLEFKRNKDFQHIAKPEVLDIKPIEEYKISKEEKVADIVTTVVERLRQNRPEKSLVLQMAEKHGPSTTNQPITNPFQNNFIPPPVRPNPLSQVNHIINKSIGNIGNEISKNAEENVIKIALEQKEKINEELNTISNSNNVSNARAKFQGLVKKNVSKEQLGNITKNIVSTAVNIGENAISDIEMGIIQTETELKADHKIIESKNDESKKNE
jgi:hypothetical protein